MKFPTAAAGSVNPAPPGEGHLLGLLAVGLYALWTLLPGSSTLMVSWPWVVVWQGALLVPWLWLLWQLWHKPWGDLALGQGLDGVVGLALISLGVAIAGAEFPETARWYGWAALTGGASLYALRGWLQDSQRAAGLLRLQGYLSLAFIGLSLVLWGVQIYQPELARLKQLQAYGVEATFSFQFTSLRNWQPLGHQNYVAGYLVLVLPLLLGLAIHDRGGRRWLWGVGTLLGLVDLYTTSSRAGWLALVVMGLVGLAVALVYSPLPRPWLLGGGAIAAAVSLLVILSNSRLRLVLGNLAQGDLAGGELSYRLVTNAVGWHMGRHHPFTGLGPGSVPLVYQRYRPLWAGREAELQFQLHSTPAQLWGELGLGGIGVPLALTLVLVIMVIRWVRVDGRRTASGLPAVLAWALGVGLLGFSLVSLTDYQLDIPAIVGVLCLYIATLASSLMPTPAYPDRPRWRRGAVLAGLGLTLAALLWLGPIHRAWALSSQGFAALEQGQVPTFVQDLERAHHRAPWEPYYPYQLGWNLGELSYQTRQRPDLRASLLGEAIGWLGRGNQVGPYQEFGHSNLGWLQLEGGQPQAALASFQRAIGLVPGKPGVFFGLGFSALRSGDRPRAIAALGLETLRHPVLLTSPVWRQGPLAPLYPDLVEHLEQLYGQLLTDAPPQSDLEAFLHQGRGALRWWRGDGDGARQDWAIAGGPIQRALLDLDMGKLVNPATLPESPAKYAILAWQEAEQRSRWLEQAWLAQPEDLPQLAESLPPPAMIQRLAESMAGASSFADWLHRTAPSWEPRSGRLGFGVLSRHIDGPNPSDFYPRVENVAIVKFFESIFPSPVFFPALDRALAPYQQTVSPMRSDQL
jgi:tetratricopeptide (TPR) repeat protein